MPLVHPTEPLGSENRLLAMDLVRVGSEAEGQFRHPLAVLDPKTWRFLAFFAVLTTGPRQSGPAQAVVSKAIWSRRLLIGPSR